MNRRDMLKFMGAVTVGGAMVNSIKAEESADKVGKLVTAIIIGAGSRGKVYASYSLKASDELKIVGVAEPNEFRRTNMAQTYGIEEKCCFKTWEDVFKQPKMADCVIITTPDHLHYGPAMAALDAGYDILLEKPIAQSWRECKDILSLATKKNAVVGVCHVLRYAPFFIELKRVIDSGAIGDVVSIQHFEPVEHIHMSHSFVRGNWGVKDKSNPMIIAKSCHDMDLLSWFAGKPCRRISSFGSLKLFRREKMPAGAPKRCIEGCLHEANCPYSAVKIYLKRRTWLHHFDDTSEQGIIRELKTGPYGRCVYQCDNDVVDHQVASMEFDDQITAAFSMEGLTSYSGRRVRIMGAMGDVVGDEEVMTITDFRTRKTEHWKLSDNAEVSSGHGGGDLALVHDFVRAVAKHDQKLLKSSIKQSMESHAMGFMAEESRINGGKVMEINLDA